MAAAIDAAAAEAVDTITMTAPDDWHHHRTCRPAAGPATTWTSAAAAAAATAAATTTPLRLAHPPTHRHHHHHHPPPTTHRHHHPPPTTHRHHHHHPPPPPPPTATPPIPTAASTTYNNPVRDGAFLPTTTEHCSRHFRRAICMPNTTPPITTTELALAYRERILAALPEGQTFEPLMTMYMTDGTTPEEVRKAKATGMVTAIKLYPKGATTNSDNGVTDIGLLDETLLAMQEVGMPLLVHGEVTDSDVDIFDREPVFIETIFKPLVLKVRVCAAEQLAFAGRWATRRSEPLDPFPPPAPPPTLPPPHRSSRTSSS